MGGNMALQVKNSDVITAGLAVDLGTADSLYVAAGVTIQNTNTTNEYDVAIESWGDSQSVELDGTALSYGMTIQLGSNPAVNHGAYVHIGESGFVQSDFAQGVVLLSSDSHIDNEGQIHGATSGVAIWSAGAEPDSTQALIVNSGHIYGAVNGIYLDSSERTTVRNSGVIEGGEYAFTAPAAGAIKLINSGLMDGNVSLGSGDDRYDGSHGEVDGYVFGYDGNDILIGGEEGELLYGGNGKDKISGGAGDDLLWGNAGADRLAGGEGADTFYYLERNESATKAARDFITDFSRADDDIISLVQMDAKSGTDKDDAFKFIGAGDFSGKQGELRYEFSGQSTFIYGNLDSDSNPEFVIELSGRIKLVAGDFLL
jgi:Ca2+-binding RTX toxin-like protein